MSAFFATAAGNPLDSFLADRAGDTAAGVPEFAVRGVTELSLAHPPMNTGTRIAATGAKRCWSDTAFRVAKPAFIFATAA